MYSCDKLISVELSNIVTSIDKEAFYNCKSLEKIVIPDSVKSIGNSAFKGCSKLKSITIGQGVTSIGKSAFGWCQLVDELNFNATECEDVVDSNYYFDSLLGNDGMGITLTIGANVKKLPARMFYSTASDGRANINSVIFEDGSVCESIGDYAFYSITTLRKITLPASVTAIGEKAFYGCTKLSMIYYGAALDNWNLIEIDSSNEILTNAEIYCYSELEPALNSGGTAYDGNYWHYVDGIPTKWVLGEQ